MIGRARATGAPGTAIRGSLPLPATAVRSRAPHATRTGRAVRLTPQRRASVRGSRTAPGRLAVVAGHVADLPAPGPLRELAQGQPQWGPRDAAVGDPPRAVSTAAGHRSILLTGVSGVNSDRSVPAARIGVDEDRRSAGVHRLRELYGSGALSSAQFSDVLDQLFAARSNDDLARAMLALPPLVRFTRASERLSAPLVVQTPDGDLQLGAGWQLAADTTIITGVGSSRIDLTAASWDACRINLRLETWGSMEIVIPEGLTLQLVGGSGRIRLGPLSPPVPGGPVLRISTSGPAGVIHIRDATKRGSGPATHRGLRRHPFASLARRRS